MVLLYVRPYIHPASYKPYLTILEETESELLHARLIFQNRATVAPGEHLKPFPETSLYI